VQEKVAKIISYIFHPLLMTTFIFTLLLYFFPNMVYSIRNEFRWQFIIAVFLITFIIPGISSLMLKRTGYVSSLQMPDRAERKWPFIFTIFIYIIDSFFFYKTFQQDSFFVLIIALVTFNMIVLAIISLWWKISIHGAGVGGLLIFYLVCSFLSHSPLNLFLLIAIIMISGAVMSARLLLNSHTLSQVVVGFCVGLSTGLLSLIYIQYYG